VAKISYPADSPGIMVDGTAPITEANMAPITAVIMAVNMALITAAIMVDIIKKVIMVTMATMAIKMATILILQCDRGGIQCCREVILPTTRLIDEVMLLQKPLPR
jgi:hypothetical protein